MTLHTDESMGFVRVACAIGDLIRHDQRVKPVSSLTDLSGQFGEPHVFTEWAFELSDGSHRVALREHRWPDDPERDCEHWVPGPGFDYKAWEESNG